MRILCIADIHDDKEIEKNIEMLIEKRKIDIVINAGDFLSKDFAEDVLNKAKVKTFVVLGNWDSNIKPKNSKVSILRNGIEGYKGYYFMGIDHRFLIKKEMYEATKKIPPERLIMITHDPPFGILDMVWFGGNAGFPEYREFLDRKKPLLHVFGHIHESSGYVFYGDTLVINAAVLEFRRVYIVELPEMKITWARV